MWKEKEVINGLNQNLFNALHELGIIATQDEMNMVLLAVEKDKQEVFKIEAQKIAKDFTGDLLDRMFPTS